ncbi:MAG: PAS domain S-box protein [Candidatus Methylumidiphilus sp.]
MTASQTPPAPARPLRKYALILAYWSLLVTVSLAWNLRQEARNTFAAARAAARASASANKDLSFRRWAASHGGVYVETTPHTPPNPYLSLPEREVVTTGGKTLTLLNPAYMLREMQADFGDDYGTRSRIASLHPLNPSNAADAWEAQALNRIGQGSGEELAVTPIDGQPYLRLLRPFTADAACLKCHAQQGYHVGDILGGVGAAVPMASYSAHERQRGAELAWSHGGVWLLGALGLVYASRRERHLQAAQQQTARALADSERRFRQLAENSTDWIWMSGRDGRHTYSNRGFIDMLGYDFDEFMDAEPQSFVHPDDLPLFASTVEHAEAQRAGWQNIIFRWRCKTGGYRSLESSATPIFGEDGELLGFQGIDRDVTARLQAEAALSASRQLLETIIDAAPIRVFWKDRDLRYLGCNPLFARDAGVAHPRDLIGKDDFQLGWREQAEIYRADDRRVMDSGTPRLAYDEPQTTPDGQRIWLRTSKVPLRDESGAIIGVLGLYEDVTEHKQNEETLRETTFFLKESQQIGRLGGWRADPANNVVMWTEGVYALVEMPLDYRPDLETGLDFYPPGSRERVVACLTRTLASGEPFTLQTELRSSSGKDLWVELRGFPHYLNGRIDYVMGTLQDITERRDIEQAMRDESDLRKQMMESLPGVFYMFGETGGFLAWNNNFETITQRSGAELSQTRPQELFGEDEQALVAERIQGVFTNGQGNVEASIVAKDGTKTCLYLTGLRIILAGLPVLIGTGIDISARRQAEAALRRSEENLNRAQAVGEVGSWLLDIPAGRLEWSAQTHRLFGVPQQHYVSVDTFFICIHPDDRLMVRQAWDAALAGAPYDIEHRIRVGGQTRWVRERAQIECKAGRDN